MTSLGCLTDNPVLCGNKHSRSNLDFWTPEQDSMRTAMRTALDEYNKYLKKNNIRRRKRNIEDPSSQEKEFYSAKHMYKKTLRKSKEMAFEKFCTTNMNKNLFKSMKTLSASQNKCQMPSELIINGKLITDEEDIVKELSISFFPRPKPTGPVQEDVYKTGRIRENKR